MRLAFVILSLLLLSSCSKSAERTLEGAIEAANEDDTAAFLSYLDRESSAFFERGLKDERELSSDWVVAHGDPGVLLRGATVKQYVDLGEGVVRAQIEIDGSSRYVWILKQKEGNSSAWRVHLLSPDHVLPMLKVQAE